MATKNLGRVGFVPKGEYSASATYNAFDVVSYQGASYVVRVDGTQGVTPGTDATKYLVLVDNAAAVAANAAAAAANAAAEAVSGDVAALKTAISNPWDAGTTQVAGQEIVVGLELYGADPAQVYGFSVIRALQTGAVILRVQQQKSDRSGWDQGKGVVCEYNVSDFDFSAAPGIVRVKLSEGTGTSAVDYAKSGVYGYAWLNVNTSTSVNLVNIPEANSRISPKCFCLTPTQIAADEQAVGRDIENIDFMAPGIIRLLSNNAHIFYPAQMVDNAFAIEKPEILIHAVDNNAYTGSMIDGKEIGVFRPAAGTQSITYHLGTVTKDGSYLSIAEKTVLVSTIAKPTGKTKRVLVIGDSFMDYPWISTSAQSPGHSGSGVMSQIAANAAADGNTVTFMGTHLSYDDNGTPYYSEAYGSWNESYFTGASTYPYEGQSIPSPFYLNGTACNFAAYFAANGTPDVVLFFLGMNGGDGTGIQQMISAIHSVSADIVCIVCTVPPYFAHRYNVDYYTGNRNRIAQNRNYLTLFDNQETGKVSIVPVHMMFHRELHYIWTERTMTAYSADPESIRVCTNHHPNPDGAKTLARVLYQYIARWM